MSIGNELWTFTKALAYAHQHEGDLKLPDWAFKSLFCIPDDVWENVDRVDLAEINGELFTEIAPILRQILQPTPEAFRIMHESYPGFWKLEPPVVAIHVDSTITDDYLEHARTLVGPVGGAVVFGDQPDEDDLQAENIFYYPSDAPGWSIPHMSSFADFHIMSGNPDSWWGAFLSDDLTAVYPYPNDNGVFLGSWQRVDL